MMSQRRNTEAVRCPLNCIAMCSPTPALIRFLIALRRRSWIAKLAESLIETRLKTWLDSGDRGLLLDPWMEYSTLFR